MKNEHYPQNLINALAGRYFYKPKLITDDILAGVNYAISTLREDEQRFVNLKFREQISLGELSRKFKMTLEATEEFEKSIIIKLRNPWIYRYITYGIVGYTLHKSLTEFFNGYCNGYCDAVKGKENATYHAYRPSKSIDSPTIECLNLSKKTFKCLTQAGINTIGDCLKLREEDIREIRGLGTVRADEVARAICDAHIFSYQWENFLKEPVKVRDSNCYHVEILERTT